MFGVFLLLVFLQRLWNDVGGLVLILVVNTGESSVGLDVW